MVPETKRCGRCLQEKLSTEFARSKSSPDGLAGYCRACYRDYWRDYRAHKRATEAYQATRPDLWQATQQQREAQQRAHYQAYHRAYNAAYRQKHAQAVAAGTLVVPETKRCGRCQQIKPATEFAPVKSSPDGLRGYCRACYRDHQRDYRARKRVAANKAIVRRWIEEVWNQGHIELADKLHPADRSTELPVDSTAVKRAALFWQAVFPDLQVTIEDLIAEGDKVVARWTFRGTPQGEQVTNFMGSVPPPSTPVAFTGIIICRITNGKIVQIWAAYDELGLLQQLGVIPPQERAAG